MEKIITLNAEIYLKNAFFTSITFISSNVLNVNCKCKCDKSCDIGEYLDYKNCKCRKKIIDKLIESCSEKNR